jgi:hypothetical protein
VQEEKTVVKFILGFITAAVLFLLGAGAMILGGWYDDHDPRR